MEENRRNLIIAFFLNFGFSIIELFGGIFTNSISILSDSFNDLVDSISIGLSYFFDKKSSKKENNKYTFGYKRYAVLGALVTSFVLLIGLSFMLYNATTRLISPQEVDSGGVLWLAVIGVIINALACYKMSKNKDVNGKAISLHMLEDVLGWVIVLIGSICMKIFNTSLFDPILSIAVTVFIIFGVIKNLFEIFAIFLEKVPRSFDMSGYLEELNKLEILYLNDVKVWSLDGINCVSIISLYVAKTNKKFISSLKKDIEDITKAYNIESYTLEIIRL